MRFKDELQRQLYYRSQIDYSYWRLKELLKKSGKSKSPINIIIDKATGFDKERIKRNIEETKFLLKTIIRCKKKLDYDVENDKSTLKEIKKL